MITVMTRKIDHRPKTKFKVIEILNDCDMIH